MRLDGARLDHYPQAELGRQVGYLPQEAMLFAGTVAENIARMAEAPDAAAVVAAARLAGAHEMILRLQRRLRDPARRWRRAALGRPAPAAGPRPRRLRRARSLVVLDEPNAQPRRPGEAALIATLARLKQAGATTV